MNKLEKEMYKTLEEQSRNAIKDVLSGKLASFNSKFFNADDFVSIAEECGLELDGEMDTNGWQMDFWQPLVSQETGERYVLSGSGWYGGISFFPEED